MPPEKNKDQPLDTKQRMKGTTSKSWLHLQNERRKGVAQFCRAASPGATETKQLQAKQSYLRNIFVDNKHRVVYCSVPKVACSSWKTVLAQLTDISGAGHVNETRRRAKVTRDPRFTLDVHNNTYMDRIGLKQLYAYPSKDIKRILKNYTKFMFVRHPLERLVSAYRDKFAITNKWAGYFQKRFGSQILRLYRPSASEDIIRQGKGVSFLEFVRFVLETRPMDNRNPHWDSYNSICHPCVINYEVIGKFESLEQDQQMIMRQLFRENQFNFPARNVKDIPSKQLLNNYYGDMSRNMFHDLLNFYKVDMDMYKYQVDMTTL